MDEAIKTVIRSGGLKYFETLSLDHDLGDKTSTGYDFLKWIENRIVYMNESIPCIIIHSMNPVGRENMLRIVNNLERLQNSYLTNKL